MVYRSPSVRVTLAFASIALLAECIITVAAGWSSLAMGFDIRTLVEDWTHPVPAALHVVLIGAMFIAYLRARASHGHAPGTLLLLVFMLFLGPAGTVMGFLAAGICYLMPSTFIAPEEAPEADALRQRTMISRTVPLEPQSLCDVFSYGTLAQRRSAVALIAANFNALYTPALKMALKDEHNAIRVQAGMVVQQLEDTFVSRQLEFEAKADFDLETHGFGGDDSHLKLAKFYDDYAYTGLLDGPRTHEVQTKALRAYHRHFKRNPDDVDVIAAIGRLLIRVGQYRVAADWLQQQVSAGRNDSPVIMWLAEALYRSERYVALHGLFQDHGETLSDYLTPESSFQDVLTLWRPESIQNQVAPVSLARPGDSDA